MKAVSGAYRLCPPSRGQIKKVPAELFPELLADVRELSSRHRRPSIEDKQRRADQQEVEQWLFE